MMDRSVCDNTASTDQRCYERCGRIEARVGRFLWSARRLANPHIMSPEINTRGGTSRGARGTNCRLPIRRATEIGILLRATARAHRLDRWVAPSDGAIHPT
jgi:hypothetical protein